MPGGGIDYSKWDNLSVSDSDASSAADFSGVDGFDEQNLLGGGGENSMISSSSIYHQSTTDSTNESSSSFSGDYSPAEIALLKKGISYEKEDDSEGVGWLLV